MIHEGNWLGNLGIAYKKFGELDKAMSYYEQALVIGREIGDIHGEANRLTNMGALAKQQGDIPTALAHWQRAITLFDQCQSPHAAIVRQQLADLP